MSDIVTQDIPQRQCSKCKKWKDATPNNFYVRSKTPLKLRKDCIECISERDKAKKPRKFRHSKPGATTKVCSKCKTEKPLCSFYKHTGIGTLGRVSWCILCSIGLDPKKYRQLALPLVKVCKGCDKEKNIEEFREDKSMRGDGYKVYCHLCLKEKQKQRRLDHIDAYRKRDALYHIKLKTSDKMSRWIPRRNLRKMAESEQIARRRAAERNVSRIEVVDYVAIYKRDKDLPCYICEKAMLRYHHISFDHVTPLTRNGAHAEDNIRLVHWVCNSRKRNTLVERMTYLQRRGPDI